MEGASRVDIATFSWCHVYVWHEKGWGVVSLCTYHVLAYAPKMHYTDEGEALSCI